MSTPPKPPGPWDDFVIRWIGVYKLVKAIAAIICSVCLMILSHKNFPDVITDVVAFLKLSPEGRIVQAVEGYVIAHPSMVTGHGMRIAATVLVVYAAIFLIEGYGLYFRKTWGEYLVTVSTSIPLPFEVYLLTQEFGWGKVLLIIGNLAILIFLIHRIMEERRVKMSRNVIIGSTAPPVPETTSSPQS